MVTLLAVGCGFIALVAVGALAVAYVIWKNAD
ncbi:hypothetical protein SAMN05216466_10923 [Paraburkholderia phenazinium]|uniref:Uncharacterized protein n=1 Tax=Paraburkholderia phenazinium TaxID=60549 RepID=A0A1G8BEZ3_9BURK|nr:hypothetical protein SAMN05216466_10923 [Paraburkholderia phenazinium]